MKKTKGFTLIELMVVIVILGILAAVIAPRIPKFVNKAKEGKTKGNLGTLRSTLNIYYSDNDGVYPVDTLGTLAPKYIKQIPDAEVPNVHDASPAVVADADTSTQNLLPGDAGGWMYENTKQMDNWGDICVNCNIHTDTNGNAWSSY